MQRFVLVRLLAGALLLFGLSAPAPLGPGAVQAQESCRLLAAIGSRIVPNPRLFEVNPQTGALTVIGPTGVYLTGLAQDPVTGVLYGVTAGGFMVQRQLVRVNPSTGAVTVIALLPATVRAVSDITFRSDGTLFGWVQGPDDLAIIDKQTGAVAIVGDSGLDTDGAGLDFTPDGTLYLVAERANGPLRTVDPATGQTTVVATLSGAPEPTGRTPALAADPNSGTLFAWNLSVFNDGLLVTIDVTTGQVTQRTTSASITTKDLDALAFVCGPAASSEDPNNDSNQEDSKPKETAEQRQQRERTNRSNKDEYAIEGNVLAVERIVDGNYLLVTIGVTRQEKVVVQVPCVAKPGVLACPDIRVGDYLEADGYQNGTRDENDYFIAEEVTVLRGGKRVK